MSFTHGMNIEDVRTLGNLLQTKSGDIDTLITDIETKINGTTWVGPDAEAFKSQWWPDHKAHLRQVSTDLHGFGQSALNNAQEQEDVSRVR